jgi:hypothetical protein
MASSVAFMDRLVGYWSLIVIGVILYVRRLKTDVAAAETATTQ